MQEVEEMNILRHRKVEDMRGNQFLSPQRPTIASSKMLVPIDKLRKIIYSHGKSISLVCLFDKIVWTCSDFVVVAAAVM
jgi:hypothetical protein